MQPFAVTRIAHIFQPQHDTAWLVEHLWVDQAVGFVGGMPKAGKTWLALELAVAVASGRPCLGRYAVARRGHVLIYAAEDSAHAIKQRVRDIAASRGLADFDRLAVGLITEPNLRLDLEEHQQRLALTIDRLRPKLLVLDPLVRLHRSDENSAGDIARLLDYLRQLQRNFALAIILVHHVRKSAAALPGQALRGSGDLHAWSDSNLYLLRTNGHLHLQAEHRSRPSPEPVRIELVTQPQPHLVVLDEPDDPAQTLPGDLAPRILDALAGQRMTRTALRTYLGVRNETLGLALNELEAHGHITRHDGLLAVPRSQP